MKQLLLPSFLFLSIAIFACEPTSGSQQQAEEPQEDETEVSLQSDTIPYNRVTYSDTLSADLTKSDAPVARIEETWVVPQSGDESLDDLIFRSIAGKTVFEAGSLELTTPEDAFQENKEWFFSDFKEVYAGFQQLMGYGSETNMYVALNDGKWFTVSISNFIFTGGAHGNYGTTYLTVDVENRKKLEVEDVFKPGYEQMLVSLLEKKVREHFERGPDAPLDEFLFENKIPITDNFGLLEEGIIFDYPPYEIAAYVVGEISLLIKYDEVADYLLISKPE